MRSSVGDASRSPAALALAAAGGVSATRMTPSRGTDSATVAAPAAVATVSCSSVAVALLLSTRSTDTRSPAMKYRPVASSATSGPPAGVRVRWNGSLLTCTRLPPPRTSMVESVSLTAIGSGVGGLLVGAALPESSSPQADARSTTPMRNPSGASQRGTTLRMHLLRSLSRDDATLLCDSGAGLCAREYRPVPERHAGTEARATRASPTEPEEQRMAGGRLGEPSDR